MDSIINLLKEWKFYSEQGNKEDFYLFGQWLQENHTKKPDYQPAENQVPIDPMIGFFLGNIMTYAETWTKLAFTDLPLTGLLDFGILKYIELKKNPTKNSIAQHTAAENSTIFEIIKRLKKKNFIEETTNRQDRRVKHVALTRKGEELTKLATEKVFKLSKLLVGNLTNEEKMTMMKTLDKLQSFHHKMYQEVPRESIKKDYDL